MSFNQNYGTQYDPIEDYWDDWDMTFEEDLEEQIWEHILEEADALEEIKEVDICVREMRV